MRKLFHYHFCVVVVNCHWFNNKRILLFHLKKYIKIHSVKYWEPDWLFRFTIVFQLNNGKNIWSSLKMQWQLSHLTNDCIVWPWSAKQWATLWQDQQCGCALCAQRRFRSAWASAWRKLGSLTTHWAHSEDSDQTGRMPRLIWVFTGRTVILLVLSWGGSIMLLFFYVHKNVQVSGKWKIGLWNQTL